MTPKLTAFDFFHSYIFSKPEGCKHLSECDQKIVCIVKLLLLVVTFGILPAICKKKWSSIENCKTQVKNLAIRLNNSNYFTLPNVVENKTASNQSKAKDCDRILNGLFLGSSKGFVEATTLQFSIVEGCNPTPAVFTNKYAFKSVITMCPMQAIKGDFVELNEEELAPNFRDRQVTWLHPGKDLSDHQDAGFDLAFNATFPRSELILESIIGSEPEDLKALSTEKRAALEKIDTKEWFEPAFVEMDKAVLGRGNTLVHCQAGVSRSATLVAAYLINRFDLSPDTAINYLKSKRACVNPKFTNFLQDYAERLKGSSAAS